MRQPWTWSARSRDLPVNSMTSQTRFRYRSQYRTRYRIDLKTPYRPILTDFSAFPVNLHLRQESKVFSASWILIGQFKFPARQPYARLLWKPVPWSQSLSHCGSLCSLVLFALRKNSRAFLKDFTSPVRWEKRRTKDRQHFGPLFCAGVNLANHKARVYSILSGLGFYSN